MKRDKRLAAAIAMLAFSAIAATYQSIILVHWMSAAVLGGWEWFAETYSVEMPASGPNQFCFDWCAPELPFLAGWLSIAGFIAGVAFVAYAWWKPKT